VTTKKPGGYRNFGFGKEMGYAGKTALRILYRDGHFGSVAAHACRFKLFVAHVKIKARGDSRRVKIEDFTEFAHEISARVAAGKISLSYGHNILSSTNITMGALRGDEKIWLRPADFLPRRSNGRKVPPGSLAGEMLPEIMEELISRNHEIAASLIAICVSIGLRFKEAALLVLLSHKAAACSDILA
jgi:hypothetical protein